MGSFSIRCAIFSVLVSTQIFANAYEESSAHGGTGPAKVITNLLKAPWINLNSTRADEVAPTCRNDISTLFESANAGEIWALQMLDASSKTPSGILTGNIRDLGMYDECIGVKGRQNPANIQGRHCMVSVSMPTKFVKNAAAILYIQQLSPYNPSAGVNLSLSMSVCLPSSCGVEDIVGLVNASILDSSELAESEVRVDEVTCSSVEADNNLTLGTILFVSFLAALAFFLVFCTACDFVARVLSENASVTSKYFAKFSLYSNAIELLSTEVSGGNMRAINGIRFLSTCIVLIGHQLLSITAKPQVNLSVIHEWPKSWIGPWISILPLSVDIFFTLSGFLMTCTFLKKLRSGKKLNLFEFYRHRYLRLVPGMAVLILFTVFIIPHLGSGPLWQTIVPLTSGLCRKNWWTNLLFVQNLVNRKEMCLPHTWYLAVEMQLYCTSPIVLYPLFHRPKLGLAILGTLLIVSLVTPAIPIVVMHFRKMYNDFFDYYTITFNRALPFYVGMLLGYYVVNNKRELTKAQVALNWILTCIIMLLCVWIGTHVQPTGIVYKVGWEVTHVTIGRLGWSLATAWILYACIRGHGGPITRFFSLPLFVPLSRLSYGIYLASSIIQAGVISTVRTAEFHSLLSMLSTFWNFLAVSMAAAFVLKLCFENPVVILETILKAKPPSETDKPASLTNEQKVSASVAEYLDSTSNRVGSKSVSARMSQLDFWRTVVDVLNSLGKRTTKTPAEWAKTWQVWQSDISKNDSQPKICAASPDVNGVRNRCAAFQTEPTESDKDLFLFLTAVSYGLDETATSKEL